MPTPKQALKNLLPAFRDLFKDDEPDVSRFLRLVIHVFDPDPILLGYRGCSEVYTPSRIVLTNNGTSTIGTSRAESDSGVIVIDK